MATNLTGSCVCGAVQYKIDKRPLLVVNCHCSICRKANGSAFSTYASVLESSFSILTGVDKIQSFALGGKGEKNFCGVCSSPLFNINKKYPGFYMVHYGSLKEPVNINPTANIYFADKLPWIGSMEQITDFAGKYQR